MQNQLQYPSSFPSQPANGGPYQSKLGAANNPKGQDRTLPAPNIKHYASNPNLSLDMNPMKTSGFCSETQVQSATTIKKNL
jgi:hypothetical protein